MPQVITTARLSLAVLEPAHVNDVHALFSAPGHTVGDGPVTDIGETRRWLKRRQEIYADRGWAWYGLWVSGQQFVGTCGLLLTVRCGAEPEIGYEIAAPGRSLGYAKEAAQAVTAAAGQACQGPVGTAQGRS